MKLLLAEWGLFVCLVTDGHGHLRAWIRFMEQLLPHLRSQKLKVAALRCFGWEGADGNPISPPADCKYVGQQKIRSRAHCGPPYHNKLAAIWEKQPCSQISNYWPIASIFQAFQFHQYYKWLRTQPGWNALHPPDSFWPFLHGEKGSAVTSFTWHSRGHTINISLRNGRPNRQARRSLIKQQTGPQTHLKTQHNLTSVRPQKTIPWG